jgi:membrane protein
MNIKSVSTFLQKDIWSIRTKKLSRHQSFFIKYLRIFVLAVQKFQSHQCEINASALSYYILLSIVPLMAMAYGISKGFGYGDAFTSQLVEKFPGQEQSIAQIIVFANNLLKDSQGGIIAGISVMILFWTVIHVLKNIENAFNEIWGVKEGRTLRRKVSDYLSMMLIGPFLIIASSAVTVFVTTQIEWITQKAAFLGVINSVIIFSLHFLPCVLIWLLFTFIYIFMPNIKVNLGSAFLGGVIAGSFYQILQIGYIHSQIWVGHINIVYGSFAAVPLFLIWLQLSLRILLFGTEVAFAHQNLATYEFEQQCLNVSRSLKRLLSLLITSTLAKRFMNGEPPLSAMQIADILEIPIRLVQSIIFELKEVGVISEVNNSGDKEAYYQPAQDINHLSVYSVSALLDRRGSMEVPVADSPQLRILQESLSSFEDQIKNSPNNKLLKDI